MLGVQLPQQRALGLAQTMHFFLDFYERTTGEGDFLDEGVHPRLHASFQVANTPLQLLVLSILKLPQKFVGVAIALGALLAAPADHLSKLLEVVVG